MSAHPAVLYFIYFQPCQVYLPTQTLINRRLKEIVLELGPNFQQCYTTDKNDISAQNLDSAYLGLCQNNRRMYIPESICIDTVR